ncbi:MAG TPA: universal stress protein [Polyangiaceae bacterium]|nr:universal stress protein [Polyangiaceae bacterium]
MDAQTPYIVVTGTDYSEQASRALRAAYELAKKHAPAELHVVHASLLASAAVGYAVPPFGGVPASPVRDLDDQQRALTQHLDEQLSKLPGFAQSGVSVMAHVLLDAPMFALTRLAAELDADVIVVGSHGRHGIARWLLGSVAEAVVRQASCPVMVIPPLPGELASPRHEPGGRAQIYHEAEPAVRQ